MRHTRSVQRDRSKRPTGAAPAATLSAHLADLVHPATFNQMAYFHTLGRRERTLTLPVMIAVVLSLLWRNSRFGLCGGTLDCACAAYPG